MTPTPAAIPLGGPETSEIALKVSNSGPDAATGVSGTSTIGEPQLSFAGLTQGSATFDGAKKTITYLFGEIPAGGSATLTFRLNDAQSGIGTVNATAKTTTPASVKKLPPPVSRWVSNLALSGGEFLISGDGCGASLAVRASCQVALRFAPAVPGSRTGGLKVSSSTAGVSPIDIALAGTGASPPVDSVVGRLQLAGVPKSLTLKKFKKGFAVKVTPAEPMALDVGLLGTARQGALASAFDLQMFTRSLPRAAGMRTVKVKPAAKLIGKPTRKFKVRLRILATDAGGNQATTLRTIVVKPARK
jgi:Domain of unknown function DUF11